MDSSYEHCNLCGVLGKQILLAKTVRKCLVCDRIWGFHQGKTIEFQLGSMVGFTTKTAKPIFNAAPPITIDEILDVHKFLENFEKPLKELFVGEQDVQS